MKMADFHADSAVLPSSCALRLFFMIFFKVPTWQRNCTELSEIPHQVGTLWLRSELVMADGGLRWEEVGRGGVWRAHPFRQLED